MALLGIAGSVLSVADDLIGGGNDDGRKKGADALFERALNGDRKAEVQLRCLSGDQSVRQEAITLGLLSADEISRGTPCGYATSDARSYAASLVAQLNTRRTIATVAGDTASVATRVGVGADTRTYVSTVADNVSGAVGLPSIPQWVIFAGGAALLVWWLRKR